MIGAFVGWVMQTQAEIDATQRRIATADQQAERQRRDFDDLCRAHAAADPNVIHVDARVVDDMPALPAPEVEP